MKEKYKTIHDRASSPPLADMLNEAYAEGYDLRHVVPGFKVNDSEYAWPTYIMELTREAQTDEPCKGGPP